ncbi:MAG: GNAT family N-acetyltransferase [Bacteroidales bacterium]|nr:GNAT family N-acetyltransferase [Bacteroidales bacterium]
MADISDIINSDELSHMIVISRENIKRAVDCSAQAYSDYPLTDWVFNGHATQKQLSIFWRANLLSLTSEMVVMCDSEQMNLLAAIGFASFGGVNPLKFIMNGGYRILGYARRMIKYDKYSLEQRRKVCRGDELYLYDLAVKPSMQGHGLASQFLRPMTDLADRLGLPIFLETHDESSIAIYERYDFSRIVLGTIPGSHLTHFAMMRQPH